MSRGVSNLDVKRLLLESGGICAFPNCNRPLISPDTPSESGSVIAEIAHIVAESREGPRGDAPLDDEGRNCHDNLIVLCPEHHKVIDSQPNTYSIQVLQQMKIDHLAAVRKKLRPDEPLVRPPALTETLQSALLAVTHLPDAIFEAGCAFGPGQEEEVRERTNAPQDHEVLLPFVLAGGKLMCFQNLKRGHNPFSGTIDGRTARPISARDLWQNDDGRRVYVRLLNRSLYKYAGHRGVRFDTDHRRFYFTPDEIGKSRCVAYKSLTGRSVERKVVWQRVSRRTGQARGPWWHVAAGLRFHQFGPLQWCLSVRPEWHLSRDGQTALEGKRVGRRVTSLKSRMFNYQYLREVSFWRDFLAEGEPRIILNFDDQTAIISSELLSFTISWPGIQGDKSPFEPEVREENLFTLAGLREALAGAEIEWEEEEEELESGEPDEF